MAKPVVNNKRFSLAGLLDDWTDEHFILYRPFSYKEIDQIKGLETNADGVSGFTQMLTDHFIKGAWLVSDDDGSNIRTEEMTVDDVLDLPVEVTNAWLKVAMGNVDPKPKAN